MKKNLTDREIFLLCALYMAGGLALAGRTSALRGDWVLPLAMPVLVVPLCLLYARLSAGREITAVFRRALGPGPGGACAAALALMAVWVAAGALNIYDNYVATDSLVPVRALAPAAAMGALCYLGCVCRMSTLARIGWLVLPVVVFLFAVVMLVAARQADLGSLFPLLERGPASLARDIGREFVLHGGPVAFFLFLILPRAKQKNPRRAAALGIVFISLGLAASRAKNMAVLGWPLAAQFRFPTNAATSVLEAGELFERFEFMTSAALVLCQPMKIVVCLRLAAQIFSRLMPRLRRAWPALVTAAAVTVAVLPRESVLLEEMPVYPAALAAAVFGLPALAAAGQLASHARGRPEG